MDAPVPLAPTFRPCEIIAVIRYLTLREYSTTDVHRMVVETYGSNVMSAEHIAKWVRRFSGALTNLQEDPSEGTSVTTNELVAEIDENIRKDCRSSLDDHHKNFPEDNPNVGIRAYACDVCGKGYDQQSHLIIHKRVHTGEKPFACDVCDMRFIRSSNLNAHKLTHASIKPFVCDVCKKSFTRQDTLTMHKRKHTGIRAYACDVCGKGYDRRDRLYKHKRLHTEKVAFVDEPTGSDKERDELPNSEYLTYESLVVVKTEPASYDGDYLE